MDCNTKVFPYSDDYMAYDYSTHMYYITPDGALNLLGVNLNEELENFGQANNTTRALRFCKKSAQKVYKYIRKRCWSSNIMMRFMAKAPDLRDFIRDELLIPQLEYNVSNGFPDEFSGLNIAKGTAMRPEDLRGDLSVSDEVATNTKIPLTNYGFCLCQSRAMRVLPACIYDKGEY